MVVGVTKRGGGIFLGPWLEGEIAHELGIYRFLPEILGSKFVAPLAKLVSPFFAAAFLLKAACQMLRYPGLDEVWRFPQNLLTVVMVAGFKVRATLGHAHFKRPSCMPFQRCFCFENFLFCSVVMGEQNFQKPSVVMPWYCWWLKSCTSWLVLYPRSNWVAQPLPNSASRQSWYEVLNHVEPCLGSETFKSWKQSWPFPHCNCFVAFPFEPRHKISQTENGMAYGPFTPVENFKMQSTISTCKDWLNL